MAALRAKGRVAIEIEKQLPVQGGLGGASANAVATLLGLERALKKSLSLTEKLRIAAKVGSDLPLFLVGGTVLGVGRGELVYPLADLPAMACVVVTPEVGVSTPKAFAEWDRVWGGGKQEPAELRSAWTGEGARPHTRCDSSESKLTVAGASDRMNELGRGLSAWLSEPYSGAPSDFLARRGRAENHILELVRTGIENDFERVVFPEYPELSDGKSALLRAGAKYASLSGSGSTLYGLFASRLAAARATVQLRRQGWSAQATATLPRRSYWRRIVA
jgi:4-diphosphocytidyl-2-C-methyl-D-erythritol kinase